MSQSQVSSEKTGDSANSKTAGGNESQKSQTDTTKKPSSQDGENDAPPESRV